MAFQHSAGGVASYWVVGPLPAGGLLEEVRFTAGSGGRNGLMFALTLSGSPEASEANFRSGIQLIERGGTYFLGGVPAYRLIVSYDGVSTLSMPLAVVLEDGGGVYLIIGMRAYGAGNVDGFVSAIASVGER